MNKAVYLFLLKTYGRRPRFWLGVAAVIIQTILLRVVSVIIIAQLATHIATGNLESAKQSIIFYLATAIAGLLLRLLREYLAVRAENEEYGRLALAYYQKLVSKDMAFFRDHQTGYLTGTFRQHIDSGLDLVRLFRGELIQTPISLIVPTVVLFFAAWQVGVAALIVIIVQIIYILWSSSMAHKHRIRSHEIYRKISGQVSDDITNIVAFKTSGTTRSSKNMQSLMSEEIEAFWQRRKVIAFLDSPRDIITVCGTALAFWMIIGNTSGSASVGLVVLTVTYMFQIFQNVASLPDLITKHDDLITKLYPTLAYITDKDETIKDPVKPKKIAVPKGRIDITQVGFKYQVKQLYLKI